MAHVASGLLAEPSSPFFGQCWFMAVLIANRPGTDPVVLVRAGLPGILEPLQVREQRNHCRYEVLVRMTRAEYKWRPRVSEPATPVGRVGPSRRTRPRLASCIRVTSRKFTTMCLPDGTITTPKT